jgi:DNA-binding transcriptional regulator YdaS (Cro superfamily)
LSGIFQGNLETICRSEPGPLSFIDMEKGLKRALDVMGGFTPLAKALGISPQAVWQWNTVPPHHVIAIERLTGVPREELRPDLYPPKEDVSRTR